MSLAAFVFAGSAMAVDPIFASGFSLQTGSHHVYVYRDAGNTNYLCDHVARQYVEWTGYGSYYAEGCVESSSDTNAWPLVGLLDPTGLRFELRAGSVIAAGQGCRHVAHANTGAMTSMVIDCRTY